MFIFNRITAQINLYVLFLFLDYTVVTNCSDKIDCGYPGLPHNATIANQGVLKYEENSTALYMCHFSDRILVPSDQQLGDSSCGELFYKRTCQHGKWTGSVPTCGK